MADIASAGCQRALARPFLSSFENNAKLASTQCQDGTTSHSKLVESLIPHQRWSQCGAFNE